MKKQLKRISLLMIVAIFIIMNFSTVQAQPPQGKRPPALPDSGRIDDKVDRVAEVVDFSEDQKQ